jgi:long-chain acyl-CoA synthetase
MSNTKSVTFLSELSQLEDSLRAGTGSLEKDELAHLIEKINHSIYETVQKDYFKKAPDLSHNWDAIFEAIILNRLDKMLAETVDLDNFYNFGQYLHKYADSPDTALMMLIHNYLDIFRQSIFLVRIKDTKPWEKLVLELIEKSNFHIGQIVKQRIRDYPDKTIFRLLFNDRDEPFSWKKISKMIEMYALGIGKLIAAESNETGKVAFLTENSLDMVLLDLACLTSGIVNVMIPANSVAEHVQFILKQTKASLILVSNEKQLAKVKSIKKNVLQLNYAVLLQGDSAESWVLSLDQMLNDGADFSDDLLRQWQKNIHVDDLATIMYTSGTTGDPKGIMFSHKNLVYKRFCRALALPEIGDTDRFLAYLPLYHTFGRWLEMTGAIFWGAEYIFMENPAIATMVDNMQRSKPTIFISIPKKWYELYEKIRSEVDIELAEDKVILDKVKEITGGELRWGLSAAGYLEPDVFTFFQRNNIELMSGFGMTEATGGITMTPPKQYIENSLGKALPGIELKIADDGELLIRGPYVMMGYYGQDYKSTFIDGWLPTGDVMRMDSHEFYEIIDRKKEIYKNIKGETVAPQKIENLFRDFDTVQQVFLVGDHRPYNTVLIYPNYESDSISVSKLKNEELESYFASVVVTVNKFLAPFERIVDFRLINRPFQAEMGELTPKSTYKRKVIEINFRQLIDSMYQKNYISLVRDKTEIRIPTWFLRERGCLSGDLQINDQGIFIEKYGDYLEICKMKEKNTFQIGNYIYQITDKFIDLQYILANPIYWIGNQEILDFSGDSIFQWYRLDDVNQNIQFTQIKNYFEVSPDQQNNLQVILDGKERSLNGLHLAVCLLQSPIVDQAELGIQYLNFLIDNENLPYHNLLSELLTHYNLSLHKSIQQKLYLSGLRLFAGTSFAPFLEHYITNVPNLLDDHVIENIVQKIKGEEYLNGIHQVIKNEFSKYLEGVSQKINTLNALFHVLAQFGIKHPTKYKRTRQLLVRYEIRTDLPELCELASQSRIKLEQGFRKWLGDNRDIAVDAETNIEYYWEDVVTFEEGIDVNEQKKIISIIRDTAMLREAIFLFSEGRIIRLYDIPPGGVWISLLDDLPDKKIYRISIQTRYYGSYDISMHFLKTKIKPEIISEINWMIHAGAPRRGLQLVENFGGYWEDAGVWTQEYLPGETVDRFMRRSLRRDEKDAQDRLYHIWPFFIWSAMVAHINFWRRSGYEVELIDKSIKNIIIPRHDYQTGQRLVSIAARKKSEGIYYLLKDFYEQFIIETQNEFPFLTYDEICRYSFYALLDAEGEQNGLNLLQTALDQLKILDQSCGSDSLEGLLSKFIEEIKQKGFIPKNLFFAIRRFHRWYELNKEAEPSAQAMMINELWDTYQLAELDNTFPETRTRFFLETVFSDSSNEIQKALLGIVLKLRVTKFNHEEYLNWLSGLQKEFELNEKEEFFLSRLSYPHLKPTDYAALVTTKSDGSGMADMVIRLDDFDGNPYWVRKPVSPKEISRLHQLFIDSDLPVFFKPEHQFLVAVSERGHVIGGLFYSYLDEKTVYMEKIVVSRHFRRKGISEGIMHEFFDRMSVERMQRVTTGFFRPEYFYRFGFKIERKYAGLVKDLSTLNQDVQVKNI